MYKIRWYENGDMKEVISRYFNNLLAQKRELERKGIFVVFMIA